MEVLTVGNHNTLNDILLHYGKIIKMNNFDTQHGYYTIRIISYKNELYFHKMKNGLITEIVKLKP